MYKADPAAGVQGCELDGRRGLDMVSWGMFTAHKPREDYGPCIVSPVTMKNRIPARPGFWLAEQP